MGGGTFVVAEQSRVKTMMAMTQSLIGYPPSPSSSKLHVFCCQPKSSPSSFPPQPRRTDGGGGGGISALSRGRKENETVPKKQPSIAEIERAIGAGIFPDSDNINRDLEDGNTLLDSIGRSEGYAERKLRETGEWLVRRAEKRSSSAGKTILKVLFLWALPMWAVAFLVASGLVKLPFGSAYLDDLMM